MKVVIESANDLCEVENLLMMADFCKRHFNHEYARNAIKRLNAARNEYVQQVSPLFETITEEESGEVAAA